MKRRELIRQVEKHSVYVNRKVRKSSTIPHHREINEGQAVSHTATGVAVY